MKLKKLFGALKNAKKPITELVHKGMDSKLIAIGLGKNIVLKEHKSPGPATIIVMKGRIKYEAKTYSQELIELDEFVIPTDEVHAVEGLEPSLFLLHISTT